MTNVDEQLLRAANRSDADGVRRCIQQGANVNTQDDTSLYVRIYHTFYVYKNNLYLDELQDSQHENYIYITVY